jgi:hypothetical protein
MAGTDIDPPSEFLRIHSEYYELLANKAIAQRSAAFEQTAGRDKQAYTLLGLLSLGAAIVSITALAYSLTLMPEPGGLSVLTLPLAVLGAAGIAAQLGLLASPLKDRWLGARYAAERLRSIKFQAFQHAACAGTDHEAAVTAFTQRALGALALELVHPAVSMRRFDPDESLGDAPRPAAPLAPERLEELKATYRELRLDYQSAHALNRITQLRGESRLPAAASEISFWAGAALGYLDLVLAFEPLRHLGASWESTREFWTLFLFALSAILFVLERGRSHDLALERYEDHRLALERAAGVLARAHDAESFVECVRQAERAALRELKAFCREADKSTYLF